MKAQGIDFGGYTHWKRSAIKPDKQVDFVICGIGWGADSHPAWEHNKPEIMKEDRRLIYQFYNHAPPWEKQADFILKECEDINADAVFIDWERSFYGVREDLDMPRLTHDLWQILNKVDNNIGGRVGGYSNFYDYWLIQKYLKEYLAKEIHETFWWFADPDHHPAGHPGSDLNWERYAGHREKHKYVFDQWSWKGYAPDYGAVNNKKSMDLTQFKYSLDELDQWLGITDAPPEPPPQPDCIAEYNQAIQTYMDKIIETGEALKR